MKYLRPPLHSDPKVFEELKEDYKKLTQQLEYINQDDLQKQINLYKRNKLDFKIKHNQTIIQIVKDLSRVLGGYRNLGLLLTKKFSKRYTRQIIANWISTESITFKYIKFLIDLYNTKLEEEALLTINKEVNII